MTRCNSIPSSIIVFSVSQNQSCSLQSSFLHRSQSFQIPVRKKKTQKVVSCFSPSYQSKNLNPPSPPTCPSPLPPSQSALQKPASIPHPPQPRGTVGSGRHAPALSRCRGSSMCVLCRVIIARIGPGRRREGGGLPHGMTASTGARSSRRQMGHSSAVRSMTSAAL